MVDLGGGFLKNKLIRYSSNLIFTQTSSSYESDFVTTRTDFEQLPNLIREACMRGCFF
jgi:hypothetical protein